MRFKKAIPLLVAVSILLGISIYLFSNPDLLELLLNLSVKSAVALILLRMMFSLLNGLFLKLYARKLGVELQPREWIGLPYVTTMGNYLTPLSGGMLARAAYLKNRHSLPFTQFATLLATNYLLAFWIAALMGLIISLTLINQADFVWLLAAFFAAVWLGVTAILFFPIPQLPGNHRLLITLNQGIEGWMTVRRDRRLMWYLIALTIGSILLNGFTFWFAYRALDIAVSLQTALLISLSSLFSIALTITPGNLGIQEAFVSLTSDMIGAGAGEGLLVALLLRASTLVSAFTLGPLFAVILSRDLYPPDYDTSETL
ncbi:MAG: flippase-like domain-containing protein [Chloroflexi bacterium]|nr:flippase-like domain-containing protein [Chloroflexota bacterium]